MTSNNLGKTFLVDECQKITMSEYIARAKAQMKEVLLTSELSVFDTPIGFTTSQTGFGGTRHWFICPICNERKGVLFMHPVSQQIGCRSCLGIQYRAQRYKGMIEENNS